MPNTDFEGGEGEAVPLKTLLSVEVLACGLAVFIAAMGYGVLVGTGALHLARAPFYMTETETGSNPTNPTNPTYPTISAIPSNPANPANHANHANPDYPANPAVALVVPCKTPMTPL
jgi:hypothetical protein